MGSGLGHETAERARRLHNPAGTALLERYTAVAATVDGQDTVALVCARHGGTPVLLWPTTIGAVHAAPGRVQVGPREHEHGLPLDQLVDAASRHEQEHHT